MSAMQGLLREVVSAMQSLLKELVSAMQGLLKDCLMGALFIRTISTL